MVGDGVVDGVAVAGWFDGLDVSSTIESTGRELQARAQPEPLDGLGSLRDPMYA